MTDQEIISKIREGNEHRALVKLYAYQSRVVTLVGKYGGSKADAQDVFQDALLILCKKVKEETFQLTAKLDTYLYGVCLNIWRNELREKGKTAFSMPEEHQVYDETDWDAIFEKERKLKNVEAVLLKLGEPCLKLLKLFYYESMRIKEIVKAMGYKTENSVKVQKYKCLERAKKMID
jgi:RNA polymerase sigma factor (sigma-70 family)